MFLEGESMIKRMLVLIALGVLMSGCFMAPIALIGPVSSGFSTASLIQTSVTTTANYIVKKSTGKTISEHAFSAVGSDIWQQSYLPIDKNTSLIVRKSKSSK